MNKVFKVIWNHATQTWTAVSELGHAKGKTKSKKIVKLTALAGAVLGVVGTAQAAVDVDSSSITIASNHPTANEATKGKQNINIGTGANTYRSANGKVSHDAIAIGSNATGTGDAAVAIGLEASATEQNGVAIGHKAKNTSQSSVAIGENATSSKDMDVAVGKGAAASGGESLAFGSEANSSAKAAISVGKSSVAAGDSAVATGYLANAGAANTVATGKSATASVDNAVAVGVQTNASARNAMALGGYSSASGERATAVGAASKASGTASFAGGTSANASGTNSVAIGGSMTPADAAQATGANTTAIGTGAKAEKDNAVALGSGSTTSDFVPTSSATVGTLTYSGFAGSNSSLGNGAVVSVGGPVTPTNQLGSARQIQNVAAGQVTRLSTDAINGSQLYSVANALTTEINKQHWNVGNNEGAVVNGVYHEDQVNFVNGNVTTVKVVKAPSKPSTPDGGPNITNVSYDVNVGKGLKIEDKKIVANFVAGTGITFDTKGDEITINAKSTGGAASSVVSGNENTLNVTTNASNPSEYIVTPVTGSLSVTPKGKIDEDAQGFEDNGQKLTTIQTTRDMVNKAHWNLQIAESSNPTNKGTAKITTENKTAAPVHAGDTVNIFAGKNINLERTGTDITISAKDASVDKGEIIPATNTTNTNNNGTVMAKDGDGDKFANITNVVNAINSAFWKIGEENSGTVTAKGNVTAGSQVNFSNGVGTIAKVTADEANKTYKVQYDINAGPGIEIPTDGANKGKVTVKVDNSTVTINDAGQLVANSAWNANATGNVDGTSAAKL